MSAPRCIAVRANGAICQGFAITGSRHCFAHAPEHAEQRADARRRGGEAGKPPPLPESNLSLRTMGDVLTLIETTVNDLRADRVDAKTANGIGYLANVAVKVIQQTDLEARLEALESVLDADRPSVAARRRAA